jgi:prepilin-type N-terminal cleavage/methylation domain-containing protein
MKSSSTPSCHGSDRPAFTLLELLLTLSVLAAIAAVAIPQIGTLLGDRRLVRAADQLRIEMTGLRVQAMRGGRVMMLQCLLDGGQFRMRSFYSLADATEAIDQTGSQSTLLNGADQASVAVIAPPEGEEEELVDLPEDVKIQSVAVVSAARASEIEQQLLGEQGGGWSQPILFYTDGTTSTAAVTISHATHGQVTVKIRGITGDVTIGEVTGGQL